MRSRYENDRVEIPRAHGYAGRVPREWRLRDYYVFFNFGGKYHNKYAIVNALNIPEAYSVAYGLYGNMNVSTIENDADRAKAKIKAFQYTQIEAQ